MKAKHFVVLSIILLLVLCSTALAGKGNNAPSGKHYTLNILGKAWDAKEPITDCGTGHRIFVNLGPAPTNNQGKPKGKSSANSISEINLIQSPPGEDFEVLDCDATGSGNPALFQLPDPDPNDGSGCTAYSVWARALGTPGGNADMKLCVTYTDDEDPNLVWIGCSNEIVQLARTKGKDHAQSFVDVSKELLTICVPTCVDYNDVTDECDEVVWERRYLFDDDLEDQYWEYDNNGLRHAQLRFYWEPSCPDATDDWSCEDLGNPYTQ